MIRSQYAAFAGAARPPFNNMPADDDDPAAAAEENHRSSSPQQFCLRWNNYQSNLATCFDQLLQSESFVDVTLACDGRSLKAHKVVLSACSPYFQQLFTENPCRHPIIIMRDIMYDDLKSAVDFMYRGEINVSQEQLPALLKVAETLKIRGLTDVGGISGDLREPPPSNKRSKSNSPDSPYGGKSARLSPMTPPTPSRTPTSADLGGPLPPPSSHLPLSRTPLSHLMPHVMADDAEIRPGIAEMIREEERAKILENTHPWLGASTSSIADSYQYQLQSMWQKCWSTNQSLVHNLRFRERGPLKSWRPETMAEAIFSVLKEGLSLSQAARKFDIPYPTFVLYANRVHNMLGPSADGGADLRPKGRGRPQRILLGVWPDDHIRGVIRAVVFRDTHPPHTPAHTAPHHIKEETLPIYSALPENLNVPNYGGVACGNGQNQAVSPGSAAAAAVAAVALRRQMCNLAAAAHRPTDHPPHLAIPPIASPRLPSPLTAGLESPMCSPAPPGQALEPPRQHSAEHFRPFASPRRNNEDIMGPPKAPENRIAKDQLSTPLPIKMEPPPPAENI